jgi:hypothetical protein
MLLYDLCSQVQNYLHGQQPLLTLREWLERHDDEVEASSDEELRSLDGDVWAVLCEGDAGRADEAQMKQALWEALKQVPWAVSGTYGSA